MKKILLVLAMVLLPIVAMGNGQHQDFAPTPIPGPMPPLEIFTWAVYVETSLPFGHIECDNKLKKCFRVIYTNELDLGQGFVGVVIHRNRNHEQRKIFIPNDKVLYIIQINSLRFEQ